MKKPATPKRPTPTFDHAALWAKSMAFMDRAFRARDRKDDLEYHLWGALALELVGKAALARVSPALVADPTDFGSILFACGGKEPADKKSVSARTVFDRLQHLIPNFDEKMCRQCVSIASRRNAELHSGESPIAGVDPRAWVPTYWKCATAIVVGQGRTMEEWIGAAESRRVAGVLDDASKLLGITIQARLERCKRDFDERFPEDSEEREHAVTMASARSAPARLLAQADDVADQDCPACGLRGWVLLSKGEEFVEGPFVEEDDDFGGDAYERVTTTFWSEGFHCLQCGLILDGREELDIAELPEYFEREDTRAPEYEEDYGND